MKTRVLSVLCGFLAPLACFASNEGVPSYYQNNIQNNANRNGYNNYQRYGYTKYVGNTGKKQILSSQSYSYQVPRAYNNPINYGQNGMMTPNGVATPVDEHNTTVYAGYTRRFADFEFKTGVNSILEWDDMLFNEINVGVKHVFDARGFDLAVFARYIGWWWIINGLRFGTV